MRCLIIALVASLAGACASVPPVPARQAASVSTNLVPVAHGPDPARELANACAPTRKHLDSDYTPGGLYAPGVADGRPAVAIDVSGVQEPVPRPEPRSRYGNRSPYTVLGKNYRVLESADGYSERGVASWYGTKFNGRATSSGELYDMCVFSAAHKTLPLPSFVRVTNLDNGRSLIVRVNDRGPFHSGRIMDLSYAAAVRLGVDRSGTARVELRAVGADGQLAAVPDRPRGDHAVRASGNGLATQRPLGATVPDHDGRSLVQVGSFGEKKNAKRLLDRLQDAGVDDLDIDHADVDGRDVWRVRIGPVPGRKLPALLQRLQQLGLPNPRVTGQ